MGLTGMQFAEPACFPRGAVPVFLPKPPYLLLEGRDWERAEGGGLEMNGCRERSRWKTWTEFPKDLSPSWGANRPLYF